MATNPTATPWRVVTTLIILFGLIAISLVGLLLSTFPRVWIWIGELILLALFVLAVGQGINGEWLGLLIDERRKMSLSRFQTVLWSVLILSALLAAVISNLRVASNPTDALSISIPPELLGILGISVTSLAGAPLILNNKPPDRVDTNRDSSDRPSWFDMFKGDDVANKDSLDLSKVQMFYVTIILVLVYGAALAATFMAGDPGPPIISAFPGMNPTIVGLLGISHAGYLVYKAVPRVQPPDVSQAPAGQPAAGQAPPAIPVPPAPPVP